MTGSPPRTSAQSPDYQLAFQAGRKRAASWFAQHGHSLALYRDLQRASYAQGLQQAPADSTAMLTGFDAGFAAGMADLIAGAHHA